MPFLYIFIFDKVISIVIAKYFDTLGNKDIEIKAKIMNKIVFWRLCFSTKLEDGSK